MTMDPKFGELSRAMRNRAVEICLIESGHPDDNVSLVGYPLDSGMYRFRQFLSREDANATIQAKFEHLSVTDNDLLESFAKQANLGLVTKDNVSQPNGVAGAEANQLSVSFQLPQTFENKFSRFTQYFSKVWAAQMRPQLATDGMADLLPTTSISRPTTLETRLQHSSRASRPRNFFPANPCFRGCVLAARLLPPLLLQCSYGNPIHSPCSKGVP